MTNFKSTSSGPRGYSSQKDWLGCGALALVKERQRLQDQGAGVVYPPFAEEGKPVDTLLGSLFGEMAQKYHAGTPLPVRDEFLWDGVSLEQSHKLTVKAARDLMDEYVKKVAPDKFGKVLECERFVRLPADLFGNELTGAIDMVTEDERGIWITDIKTEGRNDKNLRDKFSLMHQGHLYALAYEIETGIKPVGVRYVVVVKTKENPIHNFEFEGVTDKRFAWLKNFFDTVAMKRANPRPEPSYSNCNAYNRSCQFLLDGLCSLL
jgi:hypothetical protein